MESNSGRAAQGQVQIPIQIMSGEAVANPGVEGGDQRTQPQPDSRMRIVNKIMGTLKRNLPCSGQEGLQELKKLAVRFEEKIYTAATSQQENLRKISLTMLKKSQNPKILRQILFSLVLQVIVKILKIQFTKWDLEDNEDCASLDSSAQTGNVSGGDWQEEIYQKIKSMNEMYFPDLNEMYQRMAAKLQQHDVLPQQQKSEHLEKLRFLKLMLERFIIFLRTNKNEVQIHHKDKIVGVEKQILSILNSNRPRKPVSSLQQGQMDQPPMDAMQQSQISQMHANEGQMDSQMQKMNVQGSAMNSQKNKLPNLQHNLTSQASLDSSGQTGNASGGDWQEETYQKIKSMNEMYFPDLNEMYLRMTAKLQLHDVLPQPQKNEHLEKLRFLKVMLERFIIFLRTNKNEVQIHHKDKIVGVEKQIVSILNSNRPRKPVSSLQQGQMDQPPMDAMQQSQISQMHENEGQMNSQMKPMNVQGSTMNSQQNNLTKLQNNSFSSLFTVSNSRHNMMDSLEPGSTINSGLGIDLNQMPMSSLKQYPVSEAHQMNINSLSLQSVKYGTQFYIPSQQVFQATSPNIGHHSSPQIDQQNLLTKGNSEKVYSGISSLLNAGNSAHHPSTAASIQNQSLATGTPGMSALPLLAEFNSPEGTHGVASTTVSGNSDAVEQPLERLNEVINIMTPKELSASVNDIRSVVSMVDRIAGFSPGNGSGAAVGKDLVATNKCRLQARICFTQDGPSGTKKMRQYTSAMPSNVVSSTGRVNDDSLRHLNGNEYAGEVTGASSVKRPRIEANHAVEEELRETNQRLIDTVVYISEDEVKSWSLLQSLLLVNKAEKELL